MRIAFLGVILMTFSSCATITRGSKDTLVIDSTPQSATVELSNGMSCLSTPCVFQLPRSSEIGVTVSKKRCDSVKTNVTHHTSTAGSVALASNLIFGGIIGLAVDIFTGASQELIPNPVQIKLQCK
ncbi:MAG: translation initiation factor 2 [Rhodobacteraceae bacterium]|nr:translation initiation factor 2 [Paracoccaceae bacterium]